MLTVDEFVKARDILATGCDRYAEVKHLPGLHNQQLHAGKVYLPAEARRPSREMIDASVKKHIPGAVRVSAETVGIEDLVDYSITYQIDRKTAIAAIVNVRDDIDEQLRIFGFKPNVGTTMVEITEPGSLVVSVSVDALIKYASGKRTFLPAQPKKPIQEKPDYDDWQDM